MRRALFTLLFLFLNPSAHALMNGEPTQSQSIGALIRTHQEMLWSSCTASVIGKNTAITAAHCLIQKDGSKLKAPLAEFKFTVAGKEYGLKQVYWEPASLPKNARYAFLDLAIFTTTEEFEDAPPFTIAPRQEVDGKLQIYGTGSYGFKEGATLEKILSHEAFDYYLQDRQLRKGVSRVDAVASEKEHSLYFISENQAQDPWALGGDSGGPVVSQGTDNQQEFLVGIISDGDLDNSLRVEQNVYLDLTSEYAINFLNKISSSLEINFIP